MSIDINSLSAKELESLISKAKKRKTTLAKRKPIASVRKKLTSLAKAEGYTVEELFGAKGSVAKPGPAGKTGKTRKSGGKVPPKYRDPANSANTWTGRGKQPRWLAAYTAAGRQLEDFLIK
ncbi:H-NS histone family protein [Lysobacter maris]|uniref:H-NS histone family protein n=1 Tax=Marilutibacter maris TaxID=1605891 RepID=A0A508AG63_9GAMM|nr:H-NS histone family protein [Lysobacter maris]